MISMPCRRRCSRRLNRVWVAAAITCVPALLAAAAGAVPARAAVADALCAKGDRFLAMPHAAARRPQTGWASVIVRIADGPAAAATLSDAQRGQITRLNGYVYRHLPVIRSVAVRVPRKNLAGLAALPFVARVSSDAPVQKNDEFATVSSGADTAFAKYSLTGEGVGVAVLDSGVLSTARDLFDPATNKSRVVASVSFLYTRCATNGGGGKPGDSSVMTTTETTLATPDDQCGHGTHVAGIIAGNGAASTGRQFTRTFYGVARRARIVNVRVLDQYGQGNVSNVVSGIQWAINNKAAYNIRVMNLSLGHAIGESYTTDPLCRAVEQAYRAGIVVVCAAGNTGRQNGSVAAGRDNEGYGTAYGSIQSPGNSPYAITVGAMKMSPGNAGRGYDKIATYSSRGPSRLDLVLKPDIVAPGNRVISLDVNNGFLEGAYGATNQVPITDYASTTSGKLSDRYFRLSGTSMAAPVVAGAAALLLQKDPTLTPDTVKARLMISADKWSFPGGSGDVCSFGAGYVNIAAALNCQAVAAGPALSPTLAQNSDGTVRLDASRVIWGAGIWGTGVTDLRVIWGSRVIWGESSNVLENSRVIWGESVWADRVIWGEYSGAVDLTSTAIQGEN